MATESSARRKADPKLVITRVFDAPRELVFKAWTEAEQMKRWSGPSGFTTPLFKIDLRAGGAFSLLLPVAGGPRLVAQGCFALLGKLEKRASIVSSTTRLAPTASTAMLEADEQAEIVIRFRESRLVQS